MIRRSGRMEPGSGGAVFTGQAVFARPDLTAFTRARLSFFVRPLTDGTVIGGAFTTVSLPTLEAVLEAVFEPVMLSVGVDDAAGITPWGEAATTSVPSVSLPAMQAMDVKR